MVLPKSISAAPSRRIRAMPRPGSALPPPTIACAGLISPTAPMVRRSASLDRPSRFSTIRASRLRGDHKRAHAALAAAQRKDPGNKYVQNNLRLLEESYRKGKSVE